MRTTTFFSSRVSPDRDGVLSYHQFGWLTALPRVSPPTGSGALTRSYFLSNVKSQPDADHLGLAKVKRRLIEYLDLVRLRALIAQEAEMEQTKAQEGTPKMGHRGFLRR